MNLKLGLGIAERISINFLPNAIYKPEVCIRTTLEAARVHRFPVDRIILEVTEGPDSRCRHQRPTPGHRAWPDTHVQ